MRGRYLGHTVPTRIGLNNVIEVRAARFFELLPDDRVRAEEVLRHFGGALLERGAEPDLLRAEAARRRRPRRDARRSADGPAEPQGVFDHGRRPQRTVGVAGDAGRAGASARAAIDQALLRAGAAARAAHRSHALAGGGPAADC